MPWTTEQVFDDGEAYFSALLRDIGKARRTIVFETYIFRLDSLGLKLAGALEGAARRGVRVRLLVDGFGSPGFELPGVEVKIYHPLRFFPARGLNRRDHRKLCVIDGETAFVGGMNVSAEHLAWRDTSVRVTGPGVRAVARAFEQVWKRRPRPRASSGDSVRLNDTRRLRRQNYRDLVTRVIGAHRRVWIANPYFVPDLSLLRALRLAAWSGIDVRILVPGKNDVFFMKWIGGAFYSVLMQAGARIHEYRPSTLHAKIVLIDDWATVGSTNMNHRSLLHDLEIDVVLRATESLRTLERSFLRDLRRSREIDPGRWSHRPWVRRLAERLLLKARFWL